MFPGQSFSSYSSILTTQGTGCWFDTGVCTPLNRHKPLVLGYTANKWQTRPSFSSLHASFLDAYCIAQDVIRSFLGLRKNEEILDFSSFWPYSEAVEPHQYQSFTALQHFKVQQVLKAHSLRKLLTRVNFTGSISTTK